MGRAFTITGLCLLLFVSKAHADCLEFESEMKGPVGTVLPRFDQGGSLISIVMYGEATFVSPSRSLISNARTAAELSAKRSFSAWISGENFSAEQQASQLLEVAELTNQSGQTTALAQELTTQLQTMRLDTSATINGLIKIDECVDTEQRYLMVEYGWSPATNYASANTTTVLPVPNMDVAQIAQQTDTTVQSTSESTVPGISFVTIVVDGYGSTQRDAVNDALRLAVGQIYGEDFASEISLTGLTIALEASNSSGDLEGAALTQAETTTIVNTSTSGFIHSYRIRNSFSQTEQKVTLEVEFPQYNPVQSDNRIKVVIASPLLKVYPSIPKLSARYVDLLRHEIEVIINSSNRLTALDRETTSLLDGELNLMSGDQFNPSEYARFGNRLGADLIIIPEYVDFDYDVSVTRLAGLEIERATVSSDVRIKVVEVASGNILFSQLIPMEIEARDGDELLEIFTLRHAHTLGMSVAAALGGGINDDALKSIQAHRVVVDTYTAAADRINANRNQLRERNSSDW